MDPPEQRDSLCRARGDPPEAGSGEPGSARVARRGRRPGRKLQPGRLRQVFGIEGDLTDALGECLHQGLVSQSHGDTYRFSHAMIREIAYERLSPWHRMKTHAWRAQSDLSKTPIRSAIRSCGQSIQLTLQVAGCRLQVADGRYGERLTACHLPLATCKLHLPNWALLATIPQHITS